MEIVGFAMRDAGQRVVWCKGGLLHVGNNAYGARKSRSDYANPNCNVPVDKIDV